MIARNWKDFLGRVGACALLGYVGTTLLVGNLFFSPSTFFSCVLLFQPKESVSSRMPSSKKYEKAESCPPPLCFAFAAQLSKAHWVSSTPSNIDIRVGSLKKRDFTRILSETGKEKEMQKGRWYHAVHDQRNSSWRHYTEWLILLVGIFMVESSSHAWKALCHFWNRPQPTPFVLTNSSMALFPFIYIGSSLQLS